jgi:chromate transport protein ChrA
VLFIQFFVLAIIVLFIWLIARRRKNWARWVWLSLFILGLPFAFPELSRLLRSGLIVATLVCAQNLAQIVALYLIFTGNAREWFARNSAVQPRPV